MAQEPETIGEDPEVPNQDPEELPLEEAGGSPLGSPADEGSGEGSHGEPRGLGLSGTEEVEEPDFSAMLDVPVEVSVELGRTTLALSEVLELGLGSVVELDRSPGEPVDLLVNGKLVARGEILVIDEIFHFRVLTVPRASASAPRGPSCEEGQARQFGTQHGRGARAAASQRQTGAPRRAEVA